MGKSLRLIALVALAFQVVRAGHELNDPPPLIHARLPGLEQSLSQLSLEDAIWTAPADHELKLLHPSVPIEIPSEDKSSDWGNPSLLLTSQHDQDCGVGIPVAPQKKVQPLLAKDQPGLPRLYLIVVYV